MKKTILTISLNILFFSLIFSLIRSASSSLPSDVIAFEQSSSTPTSSPSETPTSSPTTTPTEYQICTGSIKENSFSGQNSCPIGAQYRYATAICTIHGEEKTYQFNCPSNMVCCSEAYFYSHVNAFCCGGVF